MNDLVRLVELAEHHTFDLGYRACLHDIAHGLIELDDEASWLVGCDSSRLRLLGARSEAAEVGS